MIDSVVFDQTEWETCSTPVRVSRRCSGTTKSQATFNANVATRKNYQPIDQLMGLGFMLKPFSSLKDFERVINAFITSQLDYNNCWRKPGWPLTTAVCSKRCSL